MRREEYRRRVMLGGSSISSMELPARSMETSALVVRGSDSRGESKAIKSGVIIVTSLTIPRALVGNFMANLLIRLQVDLVVVMVKGFKLLQNLSQRCLSQPWVSLKNKWNNSSTISQSSTSLMAQKGTTI